MPSITPEEMCGFACTTGRTSGRAAPQLNGSHPMPGRAPGPPRLITPVGPVGSGVVGIHECIGIVDGAMTLPSLIWEGATVWCS